jgi:hypothetical protein
MMKNEYGALVEWHGIGETESTRRRTCPSTTLSTKNPTIIGLGFNQSLHGETPATILLSRGTVCKPVRNKYILYLTGMGNECHFWNISGLQILVSLSLFSVSLVVKTDSSCLRFMFAFVSAPKCRWVWWLRETHLLLVSPLGAKQDGSNSGTSGSYLIRSQESRLWRRLSWPMCAVIFLSPPSQMCG